MVNTYTEVHVIQVVMTNNIYATKPLFAIVCLLRRDCSLPQSVQKVSVDFSVLMFSVLFLVATLIFRFHSAI